MFSRIHKLNLAPRERDVIKLAADGLTDKQIARSLSVAAATLKTYWTRIRTKLGAVNRVHAVAKALSVMFKEAQAEARRYESAGARLVESNMLGFLVLGLDGQIKETNDEFLRLVGMEPGTVEGKLITSITSHEYRLLFKLALDELGDHRISRPFELEFIRPDGQRVPTLVRLACFGEHDEACVAYVVDLEEKRVTLREASATLA